MNLYKAAGSIGGLTMVSRVLGFAREMISARILGASAEAEVFAVAFLIPNLFRRLFGEGAFSSGFVPLFSHRLGNDGNTTEAKAFAEEVLAVFLPLLMLVTAIFMIFMPLFMAVMVPDDWGGSGAKTAFAIDMTRITMPYLVFICLVSLLSGVLNSLNRFAAAAFAPALLNVALVAALLLYRDGGEVTARAMAISVLVGGLFQLLICWASLKRAGLTLRLRMPRMTPGVRELFVLVLPATLAGGAYYLSQFFYIYFATRLPEGSIVYLNIADRLNQLPLAIIGSALGVAILPSVSRAVESGDGETAAGIMSEAAELAMMLTLPAAVALSIVSGPIMSALFQRGEFTAQDAEISALVLSIIVAGLPAYVLIKVLTPGFYSRKDVRTPVAIALAMLALGVLLNFLLVGPLGITALALSTALTAWLNAALLYGILHARRHFRVEPWLASRIARQVISAAVMGAALYFAMQAIGDRLDGSTITRMLGVAILVGIGGVVYFGVAWLIGGLDRNDVSLLLRGRKIV